MVTTPTIAPATFADLKGFLVATFGLATAGTADLATFDCSLQHVVEMRPPQSLKKKKNTSKIGTHLLRPCDGTQARTNICTLPTSWVRFFSHAHLFAPFLTDAHTHTRGCPHTFSFNFISLPLSFSLFIYLFIFVFFLGC